MKIKWLIFYVRLQRFFIYLYYKITWRFKRAWISKND